MEKKRNHANMRPFPGARRNDRSLHWWRGAYVSLKVQPLLGIGAYLMTLRRRMQQGKERRHFKETQTLPRFTQPGMRFNLGNFRLSQRIICISFFSRLLAWQGLRRRMQLSPSVVAASTTYSL